jgi:hypothetical protein
MKFGSAIAAVSHDRHYVHIQNSANMVTELNITGEAMNARVRSATPIDQGLPETWIANVVEPSDRFGFWGL